MRFCPRCGSRYELERFCPEDGVATEPLPEAGPHKDALIGALVDGRYRIDAQIGEGGMGVVYKATHVALNKVLALKILRGEMAKDPEAVQRFMQEAQAATSIGHENIIDISDFGKLRDGAAYFVMEYLNGRPLNDLIRRGGSIPTADALSILRQIADALGAAHKRGIVHRDLKPDNVFVLTRGELTNFVKVLDFGIAKVGASQNKLTRTGMVFGTPHYMSPEQAAGQSVDARTDIYALGVIMYEMFTGRVPFDADTFMGVLTKHMFEKPAPMFGPDAERQLGALEEITLRALEKKPENRYQSMQELVDDLDRVLSGGRPRVVSGQRPSSELADALEPRSKSELRLERQLARTEPELPRRRRLPYALVAGAAVLVIGGAVLLAREGASSSAPPRVGAPAPVPSAPTLPPPLPPTAPPTTGEARGQDLTRADARERNDADTRAGARARGEETRGSIAIESEPSGAQVVLQGAIIGRTPAALPRPATGERVIELRLEGYTNENVRLRADSPPALYVSLRKRAAPTKRPAPTPTPSKRPHRRTESEVVDPWAD